MDTKESEQISNWILDHSPRLASMLMAVSEAIASEEVTDALACERIREIFEEARELMESEEVQAAKDSYPNEGREYCEDEHDR